MPTQPYDSCSLRQCTQPSIATQQHSIVSHDIIATYLCISTALNLYTQQSLNLISNIGTPEKMATMNLFFLGVSWKGIQVFRQGENEIQR